MFAKNTHYLVAMFFVIAQQALLAVSTYYIALAGANLANMQDSAQIIINLILFFLFALSAYLVSSVSMLLSVKASNQLWFLYCSRTIEKYSQDMRLCSCLNKDKVEQWLSGEASATIPQATQFYIGFVSVALNIIFTLVVFYLSVGVMFALAIFVTLVVSTLSVMVVRKNIVSLAGAMQQKKLSTLTYLEPALNRTAYGNENLKLQGADIFFNRTKDYFAVVNRYTLLEQIVACLPVVFAVIAFVILLLTPDALPLATIGILVALLPRSLQLFGNIHSLSLCLSQYFLVRAKVNNLYEFVDTLDRQDFSVKRSDVVVTDCATGLTLPSEMFFSAVTQSSIQAGRFCVTGNNGSGKTTFLKRLKFSMPDSLLLLPGGDFSEKPKGLSTGQTKVAELQAVLAQPTGLLMLDEWDANLDSDNARTIDLILKETAKVMLVVEVRHRRTNAQDGGGPPTLADKQGFMT